MLKTIWMSDPHFAKEGEVLGYDPRVRLNAAIEHINQHYSDCAFCIISGDMVNRGTEADYQALNSALEDLTVPFLPLVGNHDNRTLFRSTLPLPKNCMPEDCMKEFVQYSKTTEEGIFLCLDTQKSGADAGEFCPERTAWLRSKLEAAGDTPVYLFMHHPPMRLGLPMQDTENMRGGEAFLDLLTEFDCVKHLFIGHVHRPITGTIRGIPFATMRSILYQAPAPKPDWDWESFKPGLEAPNLGVLTIEEADVNLQYIQFCPHELGTKD